MMCFVGLWDEPRLTNGFSFQEQLPGTEAKFVVRLTINERLFLKGLVTEARTAKPKSRQARLLLKADADEPG